MVKAVDPALLTSADEGAPIESVGAVLSTLKVVEGPAPESALAALSVLVAAATVIPTVPFPLQEERETVRAEVPVPLTASVQSAVPVLLSVTSPTTSATDDAPE